MGGGQQGTGGEGKGRRYGGREGRMGGGVGRVRRAACTERGGGSIRPTTMGSTVRTRVVWVAANARWKAAGPS